jgi:tetratricopeptide (TPR) repeat protein
MAVRAQLADRLHRLADEVRALYGADAPAGRLDSLAAQCRAAWQKRTVMSGALGSSGDFDVAGDVRDIALFAAARSGDAEGCGTLLDEIEAEFGPSAVINQERRARELPGVPAVEPAPRTAWERYALGRSLLAAGELSRAADQLAAAVELDPAGRWANFYFGLCAYRSGRFADAVLAFNVCIGSAPDFAGCYYNRGLAHAALGRDGQALRDYDRALRLDPTYSEAFLSRAMLQYRRERFADASSDLHAALQHGADAATVHYQLALVYVACDDPVAALGEVRRTLECEPKHEQARRLYEELSR